MQGQNRDLRPHARQALQKFRKIIRDLRDEDGSSLFTKFLKQMQDQLHLGISARNGIHSIFDSQRRHPGILRMNEKSFIRRQLIFIQNDPDLFPEILFLGFLQGIHFPCIQEKAVGNSTKIKKGSTHRFTHFFILPLFWQTIFHYTRINS